MTKELPTSLTQEHVLFSNDEMLNRIGHVTRTLHDSLQGLGFDKILEQVATEIPDTKERLNYVARMTEQAAERVLNATDLANPLQTKLANEGTELKKYWLEILSSKSLKSDYNIAACKTLEFIELSEHTTKETKALLLEIMMAQDFQDLTGQVIKKITELAQDLEHQLLQVLIDFSPKLNKKEINLNLMNGPQISINIADDALASQKQVDDLLENLGF